jgi:hypothetical protein
MSKRARAAINYVTDFSKYQKLFKSMSVLILSPIGHPEPRWIECLVDMVAFSWGNGLKIYEMGKTERQVVHWARNNLAEEGVQRELPFWTNLKGKYTHLLWLDDDHVFNPNFACKLAANFILDKVDIVGGLYFNRYDPDIGGECLAVAYVKDPDKHYDANNPTDIASAYPLVQPPVTLLEVDAVGFGGTMMKREVLENVPHPQFSFEHAGEDFYFCRKAVEAGYKVFLDGTTQMGHVGTAPIITKEQHLEYLDRNKEEFEKAVKYKFNAKGEDKNG